MGQEGINQPKQASGLDAAHAPDFASLNDARAWDAVHAVKTAEVEAPAIEHAEPAVEDSRAFAPDLGSLDAAKAWDAQDKARREAEELAALHGRLGISKPEAEQ